MVSSTKQAHVKGFGSLTWKNSLMWVPEEELRPTHTQTLTTKIAVAKKVGKGEGVR